MAKQSTRSELERLFEVAKCDVPSAAEQKSLHVSVLAALHAGDAPCPDAFDLPSIPSASGIGLKLKLVLLVGAAGLLAIGGARLVLRLGASVRADSAETTPTASSMTEASAAALDTPRTGVPQQTPLASETQPHDEPAAPPSSTSGGGTARVSPNALTPKLQGSETKLIESARQKLQSHPAQALALTERHRKLFPTGVLAQEREVIAIEALARLGKSGAAEKRAQAYRADQPHSIHELHLRSALGDAGLGSSP
jgi:hypothetical protein